ncbi:Transcription initiation factor TFIID subunit 10 [Actinomortierella ambigua]|uniref:Transcription initiation factor TFIID subunit 10 n=1 Tax=Actinomortierella ambigua TaxID=1343610 RepID=A0A9P6U2C3_9FUNG|nr:Transcription initiation factor TFIID subunit 10 [Actinomortierella ambigua]
MSDTSGSSNDTVEDTNMDSPTPQLSQTSNASTPAASASVAPSSEHVQSMPGSDASTPMSTPGTPIGAGGVGAPAAFSATAATNNNNNNNISAQQGSPALLSTAAPATPGAAPANAPSPLRSGPTMASFSSGTGATPGAAPGAPSSGSAPGGMVVTPSNPSSASGPGSPMTGIVQAGVTSHPMTPSPAPASVAAPPPPQQQQQQQHTPLQQTPSATLSHPTPAALGSQAPTPQATPSTPSAPPVAAPASASASVLPPPASAHTPQPQLSDLQKAQQLQQLAAAQAAAQERAAAAAAAAAATASASIAEHSLAVGAALQSRKEEELNRKDRTLAEFLPMMETYAPIIPDAVTDYYLSRTGFECEDVRIKRLLALAAQKFISDIATDAFQYCKVRQQSQKRAPGKEKKTVLTMEDLSDALGEYGINVKKSDYYL